MYVAVFTNFVGVFVTFEELSYIVREDEEIIAPALVLDKPLDCCINIRAKLENSSALGELCTMLLHTYNLTGPAKNGCSGHKLHLRT